MSGVIQCHFMGRFGNQCFAYAFAAAYAEKHGCELQTDPWIGERIFVMDRKPIRMPLPRRSDHDLINGETNVSLRGYFQNARSAIYNQEQIRKWFRFRPHVEAALQTLVPAESTVVAHLRRGDFIGYNYPLVAEASYRRCCRDISGDEKQLMFLAEESPATHSDFTGELSFVPDFFRMAKAKTLLRANSSFSFWAGALVEAHGGRVFSPKIDGLKGGEEHDCEFLAGNGSTRLADFDFVDPINIPES